MYVLNVNINEQSFISKTWYKQEREKLRMHSNLE